MTTPLDRDLAERLERLAAAVPVRPGQLDPVHASAVRARHQLRMRWLTPLVVLLIGVLAFAIVSNGGHGPAPSASATDDSGRPFGMERDGDFVFTLRADKAVYAPNEPIHIEASLAYVGPQASIDIHTDSGGPIMFDVFEKVFGAIDVGGGSRLMCSTTTLTRNVLLIESFKKSGSFDGEHPDAELFKAWFADKELRLPEGTWHFTASSGSPCMDAGPAFQVGSQITIVVADDPTATPGLPGATDWQDKPVYGGDDIGNMTLQLRSAHPTYEAGKPIDLDAWFSFGDGNDASLRPFQQRVEYTITQVDPAAANVEWPREMPLLCGSTTMAWGEERHVPLDPHDVVLIKATSWPGSAAEALGRGQLVLPAGRWRITVVVRAEFGPCESPSEAWVVHASVEVDVTERP